MRHTRLEIIMFLRTQAPQDPGRHELGGGDMHFLILVLIIIADEPLAFRVAVVVKLL